MCGINISSTFSGIGTEEIILRQPCVGIRRRAVNQHHSRTVNRRLGIYRRVISQLIVAVSDDTAIVVGRKGRVCKQVSQTVLAGTTIHIRLLRVQLLGREREISSHIGVVDPALGDLNISVMVVVHQAVSAEQDIPLLAVVWLIERCPYVSIGIHIFIKEAQQIVSRFVHDGRGILVNLVFIGKRQIPALGRSAHLDSVKGFLSLDSLFAGQIAEIACRSDVGIGTVESGTMRIGTNGNI